MTQLYRLKNGGLGHYEDIYKEYLAEQLGFLTKTELIEEAEKLRKIKDAWVSVDGLLEKALEILKNQARSPQQLSEALNLLADATYSKFCEKPEKVEAFRENLLRKAQTRGYKE